MVSNVKDGNMIIKQGSNIEIGGKYTALIISKKPRKYNQKAFKEARDDNKTDKVLYCTVPPDVLKFLDEFIGSLFEMIDEKDSMLAEFWDEEEQRQQKSL